MMECKTTTTLKQWAFEVLEAELEYTLEDGLEKEDALEIIRENLAVNGGYHLDTFKANEWYNTYSDEIKVTLKNILYEGFIDAEGLVELLLQDDIEALEVLILTYYSYSI